MQDTNANQTPETGSDDRLVGLTASIVSAFVGGGSNHIGANDLPDLIKNVHASLTGLSGSAPAQAELVPAVPIRSSIKPDYITCLEDGKKLKMLKRYLMSKYNLTPDQYRAKWGLPADYPMVAPNYAETRRKLAVDIGLGRKRTRTADASGATSTARRKTAAAPKAAPAKGRKAAAPAKGGRGRKAKA